jgi:dynein heavy chain
LFLEGAAWDKGNACLIEPQPMQLVCAMPVIHFKPVKQGKKVISKGILKICLHKENILTSCVIAEFVTWFLRLWI